MLNDALVRSTVTGPPPGWADRVLLAGPDGEPCLHLGRGYDRAALRALVDDEQRRLADAGLSAGGTATLLLAPSLGFVVALLAAWRIGAQVSLLDHRLTRAEVEAHPGEHRRRAVPDPHVPRLQLRHPVPSSPLVVVVRREAQRTNPPERSHTPPGKPNRRQAS